MNSPSRFSVEALQQQRPFLRTLAMSLLVDEYHAEDAVQDTIVRTLQHGPREESGLGPWMRTVCRNLAMNLRRGNARRRQREALVAPPEATAAPDDGELRAWVVDAVVSLPEPYRDAILRRYYENQEPRDIARQLGVPATTIYSRLQKGLQRLRDELEQRRRREGLDPGAMRAAMCLLAGWPVVTPPPPPTAAPLWWTSGLMVAAVLLAVAWWWPAPPATPPAAGERAVVTTVPTNGVAGTAPASTTEFARQTVATPTAAATHLTIHGRALDEARRPLAGAAVSVHRAGDEVANTRADARGAFVVSVPLARGDADLDEVGIVLQAGTLAAARRALVPPIVVPALGTDHVDCGAVVLTPAGDIEVQLHGPKPTLAAGAVVLARLIEHVPAGVLRSQPGEVFFGRFVVGADGHCVVPGVPPGRLLLRAVAGGDGAERWFGAALVTAAPGRGRVEVALSPGVPTQQRVLDAAGAAIADAELLLRDADGHTFDTPTAVRSDAEGRFVMPLPAGRWSPPGTRRDANRDRGDLLAARRSGRWTLPGDHTPPDADVAVFQVLAPGQLDQPQRGRLRGGVLTASWLADDGARLAFTADGRRWTLPPDGGMAVPAPTRTVTVELRHADGTPVVGMLVSAVEREAEGAALTLLQPSDLDGRATLTALHTGAIELSLLAPGPFGRSQRQPLGVVPAGGDAVTWPWQFAKGRRVELQLRIGGEARLPSGIEVVTNRGFVGPVTEHAERGTLAFVVWGNRGLATVPVLVHASGCDPAVLPIDLHGETVLARTLDLQALGAVVVVVTPPADGHYELGLDVQRPDDGAWLGVRDVCFVPTGAAHTQRAVAVPAGRYRVRDRLSGLTGAPFTVAADGASTTFDLATIEELEATVELPPGLDPGQLRLTGADGERLPGSHFDATTGTLRVRARGDDAAGVEVVVQHARCATARATLRPGVAVRLRPERLDDVCFRLRDVPAGPVRVRGCDATGATKVELTLEPDADGAFTFGAPRGELRLRIAAPLRLPVELPPLAVTGRADLGTLCPARGERAIVRLAVRDDMLPPHVVATVIDADGAAVQQVTNGGHREVVIDGLAPGPHRLQLTNAAGELVKLRYERAFVVEAGTATVVTFDLRAR